MLGATLLHGHESEPGKSGARGAKSEYRGSQEERQLGCGKRDASGELGDMPPLLDRLAAS